MAVAGVSRECRDNIKDFASRLGLRMCAEGERALMADGSTWTPEGRQRKCDGGGWRVMAALQSWPDIFYTVALDDADILRFRLSRGDAELHRELNGTEKNGGGLLLRAAVAGANESARYVVERLRDVAVDQVGGILSSPLLLAATWGRTALCRHLVECGADPQQVDIDGETAIHRAGTASLDTLRYFLREAGCRDLVDSAGSNGVTPLMLAAKNDRPDCVSELLAWGASADVRGGSYGYSALHMVCMGGAGAPTVALLLDAGAEPTARTARGATPADFARGEDDAPFGHARRAEVLALLTRGTPAQRAKTYGNDHAMKMRWAEAEAAFTESIEANTAPAVQGRTGKLRRKALANRALTRIHLERWADALADCDAALELDPDNVRALTRRAKCRREQGDEAGAREDAALAVRLEPRDDGSSSSLVSEEEEP